LETAEAAADADGNGCDVSNAYEWVMAHTRIYGSSHAYEYFMDSYVCFVFLVALETLQKQVQMQEVMGVVCRRMHMNESWHMCVRIHGSLHT